MLHRLARYALRHHLALLALFIALGGSSYAAVKINGAQLENRSVAAKKIKKRSLTRVEINVAKLGRVPSAKTATSGNQALVARATEFGMIKVVATDDAGQNPGGYKNVAFDSSDGFVNVFAGSTANVGRLVWQTVSGEVVTFEFQDETTAFGGG